MAQSSSIEWTDATWSPTRGCTKIAAGCRNCYAETFAERWRGIKGHPYEQGFDPRTAPDKLTEPLKWKKPRRIFVDSMSDLFHEAFAFEYIAAVFGIMAACADREMGHTFQVLTKRPERAIEFFNWLSMPTDKDGNADDLHRKNVLHESVKFALGYDHPDRPAVNVLRGWPLPNVWMGTSISTQADADKNVAVLLKIPAAVRFVSAEPLLGPIDFFCNDDVRGGSKSNVLQLADISDGAPSHDRAIHWVIAGGESGPGARPCDVEWIRSIVRQCKAAGVPCFVKQLGRFPQHDLGDGHGDNRIRPLTKAVTGRSLNDRKGGDPSEWPADLRVREWPEVS